MKVVSKTTIIFLVVVSLNIGLATLQTSADVRHVAHSLMIIFIFWQIGLWLTTAALEWLGFKRIRSAENDRSAVGTLTILTVLVPALIWITMLLLALDNLGVNITTLVAGLGIGGVAIALATQNVLGDLLASLSIAFDKPFVVGDFVSIDAFMGGVEYIGVKSTRLRSLSGEQIVMSNADMLASRLRNYGRMQERRIQFVTSVDHATTDELLQAIPGMITEIIKREPGLRFDRCHLSALGVASIDFESVYVVLSADYNSYMDIQQRILLGIRSAFRQANIHFAYPAQRLIMQPANDAQADPLSTTHYQQLA